MMRVTDSFASISRVALVAGLVAAYAVPAGAQPASPEAAEPANQGAAEPAATEPAGDAAAPLPGVTAPATTEAAGDAAAPLLGAGPSMPASTDPAMYPPLRAARTPRPYLEIHGFTSFLATPLTNEDAPARATETFRLRWAVLRVDAHPAPDVHVVTRLGLMLTMPLLDASISWTRLRWLNVTAGQFRMPLGASATTLSPQLVFADRPSYVYAMTKASFRDLGVMLGSGDGGLLDGVLHYRLAVASGNGRVGVGEPMRAENAADLLWTGRLIVDLGRTLGDGKRLALGATAAYTRDPALDAAADAAGARATAVNLLGRTWTPIGHMRDTWLVGSDVTVAVGRLWAQAEWMWLRSKPRDGAAERTAIGGSVEAAYTLPWTAGDVAFQLAARGERVDPDLDVDGDVYAVWTGGFNVLPVPFVRVSVFGQGTVFDDPETGARRVEPELTFRASVAF